MTDGDRRAEVVERTAAILGAYGFPTMPARVLMALVVNDDAKMTSADLSELLSVSPAAISGATRYLRVVGFVHQTTIPGTRKHQYELTDHGWYTSSLTHPERYRAMTRVMEDGMRDLSPGAGRDRLAETVDFFSFLERRMPGLLTEWEATRR